MATTSKRKFNRLDGSFPKCQDRGKEDKYGKNLRILLTVLVDFNGMVYYEFLSFGITANNESYQESICNFLEKIRIKQPVFCRDNSKILHQENIHAYQFSYSIFLGETQRRVNAATTLFYRYVTV